MRSKSTHGSRYIYTNEIETQGHLPVLSSSQGVDWNKVLAKQLPPPFRPYISDEVDTGNFSSQFTEQAPVDSPAQPPLKHQDIFRVSSLAV